METMESKTKKKPADSVISAIEKTPWAITPEGLELILGIAQRDISDFEAALEKRQEYDKKLYQCNEDGIAIINIFGSIFPRAGLFGAISGGGSIESYSKGLTDALVDDSVKAILFNIDSPGGQVTGVHEFADVIYNARGTKPIYAYISGMGASAAYWIASAVDKIYGDATARVGSIGVVAAWSDGREMKKRAGIRDYQVVSSQSPNKNLDPTTDAGREELQKSLDELAEIFIENVARNRSVGVEYVRENFGKGGVLIANEAEYNRMIDGLSSLENVVKDLKNLTANSKNVSLLKIGENAMSATKKEDLTNPETEGEKKSSKKLDDNSVNAPLEEQADGGASSCAAASLLNETKLLASNPELYNALIQKGVDMERERIKAIDAMGAVIDNKALIEEAKFSKPCNAEQLAFKVLQAEGKAGKSFAANFASDKEEINGVTGSVNNGENSDKTARFNADVKAIVAGGKLA